MVASTLITPACVQFLENKKRFHTAWTRTGHSCQPASVPPPHRSPRRRGQITCALRAGQQISTNEVLKVTSRSEFEPDAAAPCNRPRTTNWMRSESRSHPALAGHLGAQVIDSRKE